MLTLLVPVALAGSELTLGYEQTVDVWATDRGLRAAAGVEVVPGVAIGLSGAVHPTFEVGERGHGRWPMPTLVSVTRVRGRTAAWGRVAPLRTERGEWSADVGLEVGLGVARTETVPLFGDWLEEDQRFWTPTSAIGVSGTLLRGTSGLRLRAERLSFVDRAYGALASTSTAWVGAEVVVGFGR